MKIDSTSQYNPDFGALNKIKCMCNGRPTSLCTHNEHKIIDELRELAKVDKFFKDNDVNAKVSVENIVGAKVILESKPVAKNFSDKIKNLFISKNTRIIQDTHRCPIDSSYFLARKLRDMTQLAKLEN